MTQFDLCLLAAMRGIIARVVPLPLRSTPNYTNVSRPMGLLKSCYAKRIAGFTCMQRIADGGLVAFTRQICGRLRTGFASSGPRRHPTTR